MTENEIGKLKREHERILKRMDRLGEAIRLLDKSGYNDCSGCLNVEFQQQVQRDGQIADRLAELGVN